MDYGGGGHWTADRDCACGCLAVRLAHVCGLNLQSIGCTSALACDVQRYCSCSCRLWRYISVMPLPFYLFYRLEFHLQMGCSKAWLYAAVLPVSEWVEFNAPPDTIQVISEAESATSDSYTVCSAQELRNNLEKERPNLFQLASLTDERDCTSFCECVSLQCSLRFAGVY